MASDDQVEVLVLKAYGAGAPIEMSVRDEDFQAPERAGSVEGKIQIHIRPGPAVVAVALNRQEDVVPELHTLCDEVVFDVKIPRIEEGQAVFIACHACELLETLVAAVDITGHKQESVFC